MRQQLQTLKTGPHPLLEQTAATRREMALDGALVPIPAPGRVTLVDFWATSCKPCVEAMPAIEALHRAKRGKGLVVVGVASDDNPGLVQEEVRRLPNVVAANGDVRGAYPVADVPATLLLDRRGRVRFARTGGTPDDLAGTVPRSSIDLGRPAPPADRSTTRSKRTCFSLHFTFRSIVLPSVSSV